MRKLVIILLVVTPLLAGCASGTGTGAHTAQPPVPYTPQGEWAGQQWEYVCLKIGPGWTELWEDDMLELFNSWGAGGWELFYLGHEAACFKRTLSGTPALVVDQPPPPEGWPPE